MAKILKAALILILAAVLLYSGVNLWDIGREYFGGSRNYDDLADQYVQTLPREEPTKGWEEWEEEEGPMEDNPGEYAPIEVDFDALLEENPDVVGWLYCEDTVINYPIVQGPDNNYYLDKLLNKSYNICGTLFIDYRNAPDFSHYNTIIYGHKMKNGSMFGSIPKYKSQAYYEAHPELYLLTPAMDYKIVLVAGYVTPSSSEAYMIAESPEERDALIEKARAGSTFQADVEILETDRLVSLSTCVYDFANARYVLVGVLREIGAYQVPEAAVDNMTEKIYEESSADAEG